jgi:chemotaxis protein MotB
MNANEPRTRIVIRKRGHGGGHHGGAWKVAYADFVTTMMALFIVLWIVGQNAALKQAVASYFKNPGVFKEGRVASLASGGAGVLPAEQAAPPPPPLDAAGKAAEEQALQEAAARVKQLTAKGGAFEAIRDQVRIEVTPEGLRVELMEKDSSPFFQVGSASALHVLRPLLGNLQKALGALPNHITVEGHTDGRQYADPQSFSNWELSVNRANTARKIMEAEGLPPGRIDRIVGHADRLLRTPDDPMHASNRRISFLVRRHGQR